MIVCKHLPTSSNDFMQSLLSIIAVLKLSNEQSTTSYYVLI